MYTPGYESWEEFDALPAKIRAAHKTIFTGNVVYRNQFDKRLCLLDLSLDDAQAILDLDEGKLMLARSDLYPD